MLGQLRLAWWRDRLAEDPAGWPHGEPLLARLRDWGTGARGLAGLVDGWEALLGDPPLAADSLGEFAAGRVAGIAALASQLGSAAQASTAAAQAWALADLALHLSDPAERQVARDLLAKAAPTRVDRAMRPLAVLAGLNIRAVRQGGGDPLGGPGALFAAIRLGMFRQ